MITEESEFQIRRWSKVIVLIPLVGILRIFLLGGSLALLFGGGMSALCLLSMPFMLFGDSADDVTWCAFFTALGVVIVSYPTMIYMFKVNCGRISKWWDDLWKMV